MLAVGASSAVLVQSGCLAAVPLLSGQTPGPASGRLAAGLLLAASAVLFVLCIAQVWQAQAAKRALWIVPAGVAVLFAFGLVSAPTGSGTRAGSLPLVATAVGAVLLLTQIAGRLARANACSCE